jgi:hypothetical protein
MSERLLLAALFAGSQAAALGRLLLAAAILAPDGLVVLRLATVFQTYSLYLMLGVPDMLYLWRARWHRERGDDAARQLSGLAFAIAIAAASAGGIGTAAVLTTAYDAPPAVALAAAVLTAGACMQLGFMSPSYLAHGHLIDRATRELVAAVAGLGGVWLLGPQWGLPGVIAGLAAGYWLAVVVSWQAWRGVRPRMSWPLLRDVIPSGVGQVGIQVGLMLLASLDLVLISSWRRGDPELPFYVLAVALLTAVSGASHAIAGPTIVRIIGDESQEARSISTLTRALLDEAARVSVLLALAAAAAGVGVTLLLPQYGGMHRWLPAVAVTCLASRVAYFPTLHLIVTDRRRLVAGVAGGSVICLAVLLYGLAQLSSAPTALVLWSSAVATCGYAAVLGASVLGWRRFLPAMAVLAGFIALMMGAAFAAFSGWFDTRTSLTAVVAACLLTSAAFLTMRGSLPVMRVFFRMPRSPLDHAVRPSSK